MAIENKRSRYTIDFNLLFPFFFCVDDHIKVAEAGLGILKILPDMLEKSFNELFHFTQDLASPITFQQLFDVAVAKSVVTLEVNYMAVQLRGYFVASDSGDEISFCGSPVVSSVSSIKNMGLTTEDFPPYDSMHRTLSKISMLEEKFGKTHLKAENYLLESDLLSKIINLVPQQIFLKDSQSRFLLVNKKIAELFGAEIKDIIGKTDRDYWTKTDEVDFYQEIDRKVIESGQRFEIAEEPQTRKDGKRCINHVVKMPFTLANGQKCILGIAIDITDIKETQQAKFEIASGVLHDIGNGVVGFGSYLNRIKRQLEQENIKNLENLTAFFITNNGAIATALGEPKAKALVDMLSGITSTQKNNQEEIRRSIAEQYNIISHIQEILNIQRQYVDGQETARERISVDLKSVINDCIAMAFASVDKRHIVLSLEIQPKMPIIKGDRTKLMQVILNLFKNSIESIDINSAHKNIIVRLSTNYDAVVIEVQDTGCGFDKATGDKLFELGFTTKPNGTGFGLHNCRQIVESHSGTIVIWSEGIGKGALVTVNLKII